MPKMILRLIHIPDEEDEQARSIIRSRWFVVQQRADLKRHILSVSRQHGFDYKQESGNKSYWTLSHLKWLKEKAAAASPVVSENFAMLLQQYAFLNEQISVYDAIIKKLSESARYQKQVSYLCCFRGIGVLTAMILVTEIGDARRFPPPPIPAT